MSKETLDALGLSPHSKKIEDAQRRVVEFGFSQGFVMEHKEIKKAFYVFVITVCVAVSMVAWATFGLYLWGSVVGVPLDDPAARGVIGFLSILTGIVVQIMAYCHVHDKF